MAVVQTWADQTIASLVKQWRNQKVVIWRLMLFHLVEQVAVKKRGLREESFATGEKKKRCSTHQHSLWY